MEIQTPPPPSLLTSLKGLGMAESISMLMKESSPSAERLELSAEGVWEITRLVSLLFLLSDSSFLFCWTNAEKEFPQVHQSSLTPAGTSVPSWPVRPTNPTKTGQIVVKPGKDLIPRGWRLMISPPPLDNPCPQRRNKAPLWDLLLSREPANAD